LSFSERLEQIKTGFERPFWVANVTELFERLSYYAVFTVIVRYLHENLNFSAEQASTLSGQFGGWVWFLAIFGGTIADKLGFRRALALAYLILSGSYFLLGSLGAPWLAPLRGAMPLTALVTIVLILPALGVALVKPSVVGTTARASKENVRSIGFSIYYTLVNIGGAAGPYTASWVQNHMSVENVFRVAAVSVFVMIFVVVIFFREPRKAEDAPPPSVLQTLKNFSLVLGNYRLVLPVALIAIVLKVSALFYGFTVPWYVSYATALRARLHQSQSRYCVHAGYGASHGDFPHGGDRSSPAEDARIPRHNAGNAGFSSGLDRIDYPSLGGDGLHHPDRYRFRRNYPFAALLRIRIATRATWTARNLPGLCFSADWNWLAGGRIVRRKAGSPFWRSYSSTNSHILGVNWRRRADCAVAVDL
jgi:MFS family permease